METHTDLRSILMGIQQNAVLRRVAIASLISFSFLLQSCNVRGFFTSQGDDPVWVDPNPPKEEKGGVADIPGKKLYSKNCAACHQGSGKGNPGVIPPLAGSELANDADATKPIRIVLHGFKGPIVRNGANYNGVMQSWKSNFNDQEIADILSYVRSQWGNGGGAITADQVKEAREKTATRNGAYTEAELANPL
ncbi:MAG: cytochrome c [Candidatus Kapabacteria bacterium]|nr:cytochrome c [Candidatus Kapabacteria bacterium]